MFENVKHIPLHKKQRAHDIYVVGERRQRAMERLHARMEAGESPYKILGIEEQNEYCVNKLIAGLCPLSYALYGRIMNLGEEDDIEE